MARPTPSPRSCSPVLPTVSRPQAEPGDHALLCGALLLLLPAGEHPHTHTHRGTCRGLHAGGCRGALPVRGWRRPPLGCAVVQRAGRPPRATAHQPGPTSPRPLPARATHTPAQTHNTHPPTHPQIPFFFLEAGKLAADASLNISPLIFLSNAMAAFGALLGPLLWVCACACVALRVSQSSAAPDGWARRERADAAHLSPPARAAALHHSPASSPARPPPTRPPPAQP